MENLAIGLIVGFVFGLVVGILFAPWSGASTRRRVAEGARRAGLTAKELASRAGETAEHVQERVEHYLGRDEDIAWRKVNELREGVAKYTRAQPEA